MDKEEKEEKEEKSKDEELTGFNQLAELQKMMAAALGEVEERLGNKLTSTLGAMQEYEKKLGESLPTLVNSAVMANLPKIVQEVTSKVKEEFAEVISNNQGNSAAPGGGLTMENLLSHSDKLIGLVNAFRSPTTEQAMLGQMNFVMKWHSLLSKLEKGGGSGDDVTKAIASTFKTEE